MGRGGARSRSGPQKGVKYRLRKEIEQKIEEKKMAWEGQTPAEFAREVMQNSEAPLDKRMAAAAMCFPYVHRKQPELNEHDHKGEVKVIHEYRIQLDE